MCVCVCVGFGGEGGGGGCVRLQQLAGKISNCQP